ncbi:hypothetical protein ACJIZ3_008632 [Penstemon smallii]|uniref:Uncharacterized protein n=1 Tax=Penstemon smallii TaxID=265156 RepID=A0ABD3TBA4_9LAMI
MTPQNPIAKPLAMNPYNHISSTSSSSSSFSLFSTFGPSSALSAPHFFGTPPMEFGIKPEISLDDNLRTDRYCKFHQQSKRLPNNLFLDRSRTRRNSNSHNESGQQVLFAIEANVENDLLYRKIAS